MLGGQALRRYRGTGLGYLTLLPAAPSRKSENPAPLRTSLKLEAARPATASGEDARRHFAAAMQSGKTFGVVITDLTVPGGMGGKKLADRLRQLEPHVRILVSSGYANDPIMADLATHGFLGVIPKPFWAHTLVDAVHRVLHADTPADGREPLPTS